MEVLLQRYIDLTRGHLTEPSRDRLDSVAVIGRQLAASGVSLERVAEIHGAAMLELTRERPEVFGPALAAPCAPLLKLLSGYDEETRRRIDEQQLARQGLHDSEVRYQTLVEMAPDLIMVLAADGEIRFVNRASCGIAADDYAGTSVFGYLAETSRAVLAEAMHRAQRTGEIVTCDMARWLPDGQERDYEARVKRLGASDDAAFLLFCEDVTDHREAQKSLRATEVALDLSKRQLIQAQKMEAIGRLAGGVAHDFNNLLTSIISFTRFVQDDLSDGDPRREDLSEVLRAADSAARLTGQLLSFSRRRPSEAVMVDLNEAIRSVSRMLHRTISETIELVITSEVEWIPVLLDPGQFEQLIFNLAVNARDAMPEGGTLSIRTDVVHMAWSEELAPGEYASIEIHDTGVGIPHDQIDQIFEPFFSTKGEKGTGLGLSTCYGIVKQANGSVTVDSRDGVGTTFNILLPLEREAANSRPSSRVEPVSATKVGGIALAVEDQPAILKSVTRTLENADFLVIEARTAEEALAVSEQFIDRLALVVSDIVLPGLSGVELIARLRARRPNLRVLLTSGYIADDCSPGIQTDAHTAFLPKPFSAPQLTTKLNQLFVGYDADEAHGGADDVLVLGE